MRFSVHTGNVKCNPAKDKETYQFMIEKGIVRKADASRLSDGKIAVELVFNERTWRAKKIEFKEIVGLVAACNFTDNDFPLEYVYFLSDLTNKDLGHWLRGQLTVK